ncbi:hypothetical protein [Agarilytica rhodophyticola]|uniref:hypothetical protein n=1 Tax=Agarilytica rhodophyticola TaxID=1737490 RepID=UPI000B3421B3|nr:hypothetical protein [Agarilytica rhodophyticola]
MANWSSYSLATLLKRFFAQDVDSRTASCARMDYDGDVNVLTNTMRFNRSGDLNRFERWTGSAWVVVPIGVSGLPGLQEAINLTKTVDSDVTTSTVFDAELTTSLKANTLYSVEGNIVGVASSFISNGAIFRMNLQAGNVEFGTGAYSYSLTSQGGYFDTSIPTTYLNAVGATVCSARVGGLFQTNANVEDCNVLFRRGADVSEVTIRRGSWLRFVEL